MSFRGAMLALGVVALVLGQSAAQDSGQPASLPSAPSAVKEREKPAPPPQPAPAPPKPSAAASGSATPSSSPAQPSHPASVAAATSTKAPAATSQPSDEDITATFHKTVNEVGVVFTVTDKHGHYIKDLKKSDFRVLDDNQPPAEIRSFHSETDLPLDVGLLIDASNSIRDRFRFEQESAIEFLNQTVRPRYDKAFVVGFDVTPEVTQDFTDNTELLSHGVRELRAGGGTAMYDAVYFACRDKLLKIQQTMQVRKAIILLSDGDDNQSHVTREEAIDMAQRAGVIIYTISTNITGGGQRGDKVLERIADATGGRAFFPFQLRDVASAFTEIQDELRSQYALFYTPANFVADGRYRTIEILAKNHKNLRVRSPRGYYAPSQ
jgi:Ca-activated chloride channel family protein